MASMKWILISVVMSVLYGIAGNAEVPSFLERLKRDPISAAKEIPEKRGVSRQSLFDSKSIKRRDYVAVKDKYRSKTLCSESAPGESCIKKNNYYLLEGSTEDSELRKFLGSSYETNVLKLDAYSEGRTSTVPWSGYYWATYEGGIGNRYGDKKFPRSQTFKINYEYFKNNYLQSPPQTAEGLSLLSPSEKYDVLLNDRQWNLTQAVWSDASTYMDASGRVETWMGICNGWAPAAMAVPEPKKAVTLNLDGHRGRMTLYPHDLKGLISQLWAEVSVDYSLLGGRCNEKNPKTDPTGRIFSSSCFYINPSVWHLALTHLVGRQGQGFVLDATYDYEVWNQPIYSYKLKYFNPNTRSVGSMSESLVAYEDVTNDLYRSYRSSDTKYLLGVTSEIQYVVEEQPYQSEHSTDPFRRLVTVTYYYDLELDENYNIIGGEWYQKAHPDILWRPTSPGARPRVSGEDRLNDWEGHFPLPQELVSFAERASAYKIPLSKVLDQLIEWASR